MAYLVAAFFGIVLFLVGVGAMVGWVPEDFYILGFFGLLLTAIILFITGANQKGRSRWHNISLGFAMLIGLSVLYFYSLGFILAPISLILLVWSIRKWALQPTL